VKAGAQSGFYRELAALTDRFVTMEAGGGKVPQFSGKARAGRSCRPAPAGSTWHAALAPPHPRSRGTLYIRGHEFD